MLLVKANLLKFAMYIKQPGKFLPLVKSLMLLSLKLNILPITHL